MTGEDMLQNAKRSGLATRVLDDGPSIDRGGLLHQEEVFACAGKGIVGEGGIWMVPGRKE